VVDAILDCLLFSQQLQVLDIIQTVEELSKELYSTLLEFIYFATNTLDNVPYPVNC
jgi:hypothetical protein